MDKAYFEKYLDYQYSRIERKVAKIDTADVDKKQRILVSLTGYEIDLLKAEFSFGATCDDMKTLLNKAIITVNEYENMTYEDLLILLSLSIIVNDSREAKKLVDIHSEKVKGDRLLNLFSRYICDKTVEWNENLQLCKEFEGLNNVFESDEKENALINYLNEWYAKFSEYAWYDSHLRDTDTYCGYWSFESAAIATILGLNDSELKSCEYYPSL